MTEDIPQLTITSLPNGNVRLENVDPVGNEVNVVDIHPIQVRLIAERLGLVPTSDVTTARRIETLCRRLRVLQHRVGHLADYLINDSDHEHANLEWEMTFAAGTRDIADEFVADLDDWREAAPVMPSAPKKVEMVSTFSPTPSAGGQLELPT
ncbi:hypothetical protein H010_00585 [Hydrogenophaga taeniospiralis CCUG 15921]|uniref:Uncharacterized protein n=1 Tax=Hydrogenophaga taeniospiralis CCUG 15921 TaxID=1281780 RepID=A0A9X4NNK8_9BURK|nr:hypothetical protein [Hydrogenophaga taeniospiralis]MDG5973724.1 hypothetical protein [Hydrogenophaga taeniospiralis CCUG 15921]